MSISLPGCSSWNDRNNEEEIQSLSFKGPFVVKGGIMSPGLLKSLSGADTQNQPLLAPKRNRMHHPPSLLEHSFNVYFTQFSDEKILPFLLSRLFPLALMKKYQQLSLERQKNKLIEEEYDKDHPLFYREDERKKNKASSLLEHSLDVCFINLPEESLLKILLSSNFPVSFFQRYSQLSLKKQKTRLSQKITTKGEIFFGDRIRTALLSRFPSIFKNDPDLGFFVSCSCFFQIPFLFTQFLSFFKDDSHFSVKKRNGYFFLKEFIEMEKTIVMDLFSSLVPSFFQNFSSMPCSSEEQKSFNFLDRFQSTIWILKLLIKAQIFCSQNLKFLGIENYKDYLYKNLKLCSKIQKKSDHLKTAIIFLLPKEFKISYQKLNYLMHRLDHLTRFRRSLVPEENKTQHDTNLKKG